MSGVLLASPTWHVTVNGMHDVFIRESTELERYRYDDTLNTVPWDVLHLAYIIADVNHVRIEAIDSYVQDITKHNAEFRKQTPHLDHLRSKLVGPSSKLCVITVNGVFCWLRDQYTTYGKIVQLAGFPYRDDYIVTCYKTEWYNKHIVYDSEYDGTKFSEGGCARFCLNHIVLNEGDVITVSPSWKHSRQDLIY